MEEFQVEQRMSQLAVISVTAGHSTGFGEGEREKEREVVGREEE